MTTYSNKQNTRRAARKALGNDQAVEGQDFTIVGTEGAWEFALAAEAVNEATAIADAVLTRRPRKATAATPAPEQTYADQVIDCLAGQNITAEEVANHLDLIAHCHLKGTPVEDCARGVAERVDDDNAARTKAAAERVDLGDPRIAEHPIAQANAASWPSGKRGSKRSKAPIAPLPPQAPAAGITSTLLRPAWPVTDASEELALGDGATLLMSANGINIAVEFHRGLVPGALALNPDQAARLATFLAAAMKPAKVRKERMPRPAGDGTNKREVCKALLLQPEGTTASELLAATGWPTISVPATAASSGLALRKVKAGKVTRYFGFTSEAEAEAAGERIASQAEAA